MVSVVQGPFTNDGKQAALQKEIKENYDSYFAKADAEHQFTKLFSPFSHAMWTGFWSWMCGFVDVDPDRYP